nr:unnamed protein product [Spirometra erinaceieuropaei]
MALQGHFKGLPNQRQISPGTWENGARYRRAWKREAITGAAIYEANLVTSAKAKMKACNSQVPHLLTANHPQFSTFPHYQRVFRARICLIEHFRTPYAKNLTSTSLTFNPVANPLPNSTLITAKHTVAVPPPSTSDNIRPGAGADTSVRLLAANEFFGATGAARRFDVEGGPSQPAAPACRIIDSTAAMKVHKDGAPPRPIVSLIETPTYGLAKCLFRRLKFLTAESDTTVSSSAQFLENLKGDLAIEKIELLIQSKYDETENRLGHAQVPQHLKLCLRTYFTFNGTNYEQVKGTPMGSPISGFIVEAVLQRLESLVFQHHRPKFWARFPRAELFGEPVLVLMTYTTEDTQGVLVVGTTESPRRRLHLELARPPGDGVVVGASLWSCRGGSPSNHRRHILPWPPESPVDLASEGGHSPAAASTATGVHLHCLHPRREAEKGGG